MPKMVCIGCEVELRCEKNGVTVAELFQGNSKIYKLWSADIWECPRCGGKVVAGFAQEPFREHFSVRMDERTCEQALEKIKKEGGTVVYSKEVVRGE